VSTLRSLLAGLLFLGLLAPLHAAEPADLRRGLITLYQDKTGTAVHCLEPTVALSLRPNEAPDSRLQSTAGLALWKGHLHIAQPGNYRFSANLRGEVRVKVAGREVLAASEKSAEPRRKEGPEVNLPAGVHPFEVRYHRFEGLARLELLWQSPFFRREPLPYDAVGHLPTEIPVALTTERQIEEGRLLAEEASCLRCHQPDDKDAMGRGVQSRSAPDLSTVGRRVRPGWLEHWLDDPRKLRPATTMPALFSKDEVGRTERHAVARYLVSLGGPLPASKPAGSPAEGERLYVRLGCIACHGSQERASPALLYQPVRLYPLTGLGSKTTDEPLRDYLRDPLTINPSGRMPHLLLTRDEAQHLATFLLRSTTKGIDPNLSGPPGKEQLAAAFRRVDPRPDELTAFQKLPLPQQILDLGQRIVIARGCNNCHTIEPDGKPFAQVLPSATLDDLRQPANLDKGCLAEKLEKDRVTPRYDFTREQRTALRLFLTRGLQGAGTPAPAQAARRDLERFNCLACHTRDGEGGLPASVTARLRSLEKAEHDEAVVPPSLTGVGHKLRTTWLRGVLVSGGRARPWMGLRMPRFGAGNVGPLAESLAALEGTIPEDTIHQVDLTPALTSAGRRLAGRSAFGCVSCHDIAGIPNTGTRGPDLAGMTQRVRYEWYLRWLEQPQRLAPGTRMPTVFAEGRSPLKEILGGRAEAQAEALWGYLSLGKTLPLPEGVEPPKGKRGPGPGRPKRPEKK
jgi:mono/diheme cytochrome c family protein